MEEHFDFAAFFAQKLKERGLSVRKLSEMSGISLKDLEILAEGDMEHLPPAPYLKGYTTRLAKILEFDPEVWWQYFESTGTVRRSGVTDMLPQNRFALSKKMRWGWMIAIGSLVILYGILRFSAITGRPTLEITSPQEEGILVHEDTYTLRGLFSGGTTLTVNGDPITVEQKAWEYKATLKEGQNTLEFVGKKRLGKEVRETRQIFFEKPQEVTASSTPETR